MLQFLLVQCERVFWPVLSESSVSFSDSTMINGFKVKGGMFGWDMVKKLFPVQVVRHWYSVLREAVDPLSLAVFRARLEGSFPHGRGVGTR